MRGITYQTEAQLAADAARVLWERADDVIATIEWTLARDQHNPGEPYGGTLRLIVFPGAKSGKLPSVDCLFELTPERVIIHELEFY